MIDREDELYEDVCASIIKWCDARIAEMSFGINLTYIDWDAHSEASLAELPSNDLLGPAGIGMTEEGTFHDVVFSIGISVMNDQNLFRIRKMVSKVFGALKPGKQIPIYRRATAVNTDTPPVSWLVLESPTIITPVSRAETRVLQFVMTRGRLNPLTAHVG